MNAVMTYKAAEKTAVHIGFVNLCPDAVHGDTSFHAFMCGRVREAEILGFFSNNLPPFQ